MLVAHLDQNQNVSGFTQIMGLTETELVERGYILAGINTLEEAKPAPCYEYLDGKVQLKADWEAILATFPEPEPVPEPAVIGATAYRVQEIEARLLVIDQLTIRPLRAELAGTGTEADRDRLGELEAEATELRGELQSLRV